MGLVLEKNDLLKKHQPIQEDLVNVINLQKFDRKANLSLSGYKFIDLFAGIGGIRTPFDELEAQCVFSSEWDKYAQQTYASNYGDVPMGILLK